MRMKRAEFYAWVLVGVGCLAILGLLEIRKEEAKAKRSQKLQKEHQRACFENQAIKLQEEHSIVHFKELSS